MAKVRCPICEKYFDSDRAAAMPFCCERCRQIDLGRWLDEKYGVALEPGDEAEAGGWDEIDEV